MTDLARGAKCPSLGGEWISGRGRCRRTCVGRSKAPVSSEASAIFPKPSPLSCRNFRRDCAARMRSEPIVSCASLLTRSVAPACVWIVGHALLLGDRLVEIHHSPGGERPGGALDRIGGRLSLDRAGDCRGIELALDQTFALRVIERWSIAQVRHSTAGRLRQRRNKSIERRIDASLFGSQLLAQSLSRLDEDRVVQQRQRLQRSIRDFAAREAGFAAGGVEGREHRVGGSSLGEGVHATAIAILARRSPSKPAGRMFLRS